MIDLRYSFKKLNNEQLLIHLFDCQSDNAINIKHIVTKRQLKDLTSIVQESNFPISIAYIMIQDYQKYMERKILDIAPYILEKKTLNAISSYTREICSNPLNICTVEWITKFANDIEKEIEFLR